MPARRLERALIGAALVATFLVVASPAHAVFHLMRIREVSVGPVGFADADFVELQMYSNFQRFVAGTRIRVFDADGDPTTTFTFPSDVAVGANQSSILVGGAGVDDLYGVTPDFVTALNLPAAGGKVCFSDNAMTPGDVDCVAWGAYTGPAGSGGSAVGNPFNAAEGIPVGAAIERDISAGDPNALEGPDDTGDSAADFDQRPPSPRNNVPVGSPGAASGGNVSFSASAFSGSEDGTVAVTVSRAGDTSDAVGVAFTTTDGTATAGSDYTDADATISFAAGDASETVNVSLLPDLEEESSETVSLRLRDPSGGAVLGARPDATLTITDVADVVAPVSEIRRPVHGATYRRDRLTSFRGIATDDAAGIGTVELALRRRITDGSCEAWTGTRFRDEPCATRLWLTSGTASPWTYLLPVRLRPSIDTEVRSYTLYARATDAAGNVEDAFDAGRNQSLFEIRR